MARDVFRMRTLQHHGHTHDSESLRCHTYCGCDIKLKVADFSNVVADVIVDNVVVYVLLNGLNIENVVCMDVSFPPQ